MVKDIIKGIIDNNGAFVAAHGEAYFKPHMTAQHPRITLVACCDSRVQPLVIDPDPIDKVFTIETIGNQVASAQGSVDYGILHLHTPVLLIILITAAGGAFGAMLRAANVGAGVETLFRPGAAGASGVAVLLLAALMSSVFKVAQGSSTVAMLTTSALFGAMLPGGGQFNAVMGEIGRASCRERVSECV